MAASLLKHQMKQLDLLARNIYLIFISMMRTLSHADRHVENKPTRGNKFIFFLFQIYLHHP